MSIDERAGGMLSIELQLVSIGTLRCWNRKQFSAVRLLKQKITLQASEEEYYAYPRLYRV
jgi:hypothetical protein